MSLNVKILAAALGAALVAVLVVVLVPWGGSKAAHRADSRRLSPGTEATFVEFLDFECSACAAVHPALDQLRAEYGDRIGFVVRYFPIDAHQHAEPAARAVEAAARQGAFAPMAQRMFETRGEWGGRPEPMDERFRGYAAGLGLDLAEYDRVYAAPETLDRVRSDRADGEALGVRGTPSFFLDGERLQPQTVGDLVDAFDAVLAR